MQRHNKPLRPPRAAAVLCPARAGPGRGCAQGIALKRAPGRALKLALGRALKLALGRALKLALGRALKRALGATLGLGLGQAPAAGAGSRPVYPGPYEAELVEVVDGDTLRLRVRVWPGLEAPVLVRLRGIDAPERQASCPTARHHAQQARALLADLAGSGPLQITEVAFGPFSGRLLAHVQAGSTDLSQAMLAFPDIIQPWPRVRKWCP